MDSQTKVDRTQLSLPTVTCNEMAFTQLGLMIDNDITLKGKYLRLLISGKGCDGFTYSIGFTDMHDEDLQVPLLDNKKNKTSVEILMDPFTAFYLQDCTLDYIQDFENNNEGFKVINNNQNEFAGKFWRKDDEKVPPVKEDYGLPLS